MSKRSLKFVSAIIAGLLAGINFSAVAENTTAAVDDKAAGNKIADNCMPGPKGALPAGGHWYYRVDRATKRHCWYVGEEKDKTAKAAPAAQDITSPAIATTDPTPPQPATKMRQSVADARAELPSPQTASAQDSVAGLDNNQPATAPVADTQSSTVSSRWPAVSGASSSGNVRLANAGPPASAPIDTRADTQSAMTPPAAPEASTDRQSSSMHMLLLVMAGALAVAGLIGAVVLRLNRVQKPAYEIRDEWRAPWDPVPVDRQIDRPLPLAFPRRYMSMRDREAELPKRRVSITRDPRAPDNPDRRIAEMLQRLARTAAS